MRTAEEIYDSLVRHESITELYKSIIEMIKTGQREAIEKCAERAETIDTDSMTNEQYIDGAPSGYDTYKSINKQSILSLINELK